MLFRSLSRHVDLNLPMLCKDPSHCIELLYYSQIRYIPLLIENGCKLDPRNIIHNIERLVLNGNINKLIALYRYGAITKDQLIPLFNIPFLIFRILDQLYEKIFAISQKISEEQKFNEVYGEIIKNYVNTFKFFYKNGINFNQVESGESFFQRVMNTYFADLISYVISCNINLDTIELTHYSNFDLINREVMRYIYNEGNYRKLHTLVDDKITPKKIIRKKNLTKKIIPIDK